MRALSATTLLLTAMAAWAQTDVKVDPRFERFQQKVAAAKGLPTVTVEAPASANHFYATYADFLGAKPVPDMILNSIGGSSLTVTNGGTQEKLPLKDLETRYWGFCDRFGLLHRIYKKDTYQVIIAGKVTQYVKRDEASGTINADSTFTLIFGSPQGGYFDYGSKGVNGEIVDLDVSYKGESKALSEFMSDHPEVLEALKADRDDARYVGEKYRKRENLTYRIQHHIREYNKL